jgi:hypothetical protein
MPEKVKPASQAKKSTGKASAAKTGTARPKAAAARKAPGKAAKAAAPKKAPGKAAQSAGRKLTRVPLEYVFYCQDGSIYNDLEELAAGLAAMTDETFAYHCNNERQDFCNWVRDVIEDVELAEELAMAASRIEAADFVADRVLFLSQ